MNGTVSSEQRAVRLIGVASGLGVPVRMRAGSQRAAVALEAEDVGAGMRRNRIDCAWDELIAPGDPSLPRDEALRRLCRELEERVAACIGSAALPVVLGGDHAMAVGTWRGTVRALGGRPGLLWIDAHLDAHTSRDSPSGNPHGMPLAALFGCGPNPWDNDEGVLDASRCCVFGVRSYEESEWRRMDELGVRIVTMDDIRRRGLPAALGAALAHVGGGAFGVSIDLDAIDPAAAPGVNTPCADGLDAAALVDALRSLANDPQLAAVEIAEYNPDRDADGRTARLVADLLESLTAPTGAACRDIEAHYGAHNYEPLPVVLARGAGVHVWDTEGRRYLDMMSAYSAASFGHGHPRLVAALTRQAGRLAVTSRAYFNDRLPLLLARLCELFGYAAALPVNTGLEAVETALKAARKWGYRHKGVATDQAEIIACDGNFHGRSIAIVGMSSEAQYRDGFGPFPPGFRRVPYGDAAALAAAITPQTVAFLVEPVQGEGGIVVPPDGYLRACADICRRHRVLLICDEVQTGLGRTGKLLASWHDGVRPDAVILGKALGGGLLPVSAFLADREVMDVFTPGDHGSTFGGNALAAAVALEALDLLVELDLPARSAALGEHLLARLRQLDNPAIRAVRGRGLFAGIELDPRCVDAHTACLRLLDAGVLSKDTHGNVIRIAPPLVIEPAQLDEGIDRIAACLRQFAPGLPLAA
ncbi:MAG: ornithine--oxo-acid transaminase [Rhodocyclaceae bacterium]|nr:ornithine--oxo-acid transaminase [Rhodocyclaceae bacterium]